MTQKLVIVNEKGWYLREIKSDCYVWDNNLRYAKVYDSYRKLPVIIRPNVGDELGLRINHVSKVRTEYSWIKRLSPFTDPMATVVEVSDYHYMIAAGATVTL